MLFRSTERQRQDADRFSRSMEQTITALASVTEARSPYTAGHQRRVAGLTRAIGTAMGVDGNRLHGIVLAASIHDIGDVQQRLARQSTARATTSAFLTPVRTRTQRATRRSGSAATSSASSRSAPCSPS